METLVKRKTILILFILMSILVFSCASQRRDKQNNFYLKAFILKACIDNNQEEIDNYIYSKDGLGSYLLQIRAILGPTEEIIFKQFTIENTLGFHLPVKELKDDNLNLICSKCLVFSQSKFTQQFINEYLTKSKYTHHKYVKINRLIEKIKSLEKLNLESDLRTKHRILKLSNQRKILTSIIEEVEKQFQDKYLIEKIDLESLYE